MLALVTVLNFLTFPGCQIRPYGSYVYGLATIHSDIDASIMLPEHNGNYKNLVEDARSVLQQHSEFTDFTAITWVLVPVLSFRHIPSQFSIDISINAYREFQISKLIKYLVGIDQRIFNLAFIVKHWAKLNNITGSHLLANYGMTVLVIFYLQQKKVLPSIASLQEDAEPFMFYDWDYGFNELNYKVQNNQSLNVLLGEFFEYYTTFDFEKYIVSPYAGYPIERILFEDLDRVPYEFELYNENVKNNVAEPLSLTKPVLLQDMFIHNQAVMSRQSPHRDSSFMRLFHFAAQKYHENKNTFLKELINEDVILFMKYIED